MDERADHLKIQACVLAGAISALREAAMAQRKAAANGTSDAGPKFPGVTIKSPEAACAAQMAADWDAIADELGRR